MELQTIMDEMEKLGLENDQVQSDKSKKYLNITRDTGEFLSVLVKATGSKKILEIGTSNGYSTIWLADALPHDGMVYTVEVNPQKVAEAAVNFSNAKVTSRVTQLEGNVIDVLAGFSETVDFIFLDADRKLYVPLAETLFGRLRSGGLLVCDNATSHHGELKEFTDWLHSQNHLNLSLVPVGKGELLVYKGEKPV